MNGLRVLVVDDEMMVAMLLEDMLSELGCTVIGPVSNVADAMSRLETGDVQAALLDVNLSHGQSGYPIAEELTRRGLPFAFVTGYGAGSLNPRFKDNPTLQKPFHLAALIKVLGELAQPA